VPPELMPDYRRFLLSNFQARARKLGWIPRADEPDDVRLLRPELVRAVATYGGDQELAKQAEKLAQQWLADHAAVNPDILRAVLDTAAFYGDLSLFNRFLAEFQKTPDRQEKQRLLGAMTSFRNRAAIEAGMQAVLTRTVSLADGFPLMLYSGQNYTGTRKMAFEFVRAHFDRIMTGSPSIFGFDLAEYLPQVGASFCDAQSRNELRSFFEPLEQKYPGMTRPLAQVTERIDLCIAKKADQEGSVKSFLRKY
jgi:alanyl aminopeptidase